MPVDIMCKYLNDIGLKINYFCKTSYMYWARGRCAEEYWPEDTAVWTEHVQWGPYIQNQQSQRACTAQASKVTTK